MLAHSLFITFLLIATVPVYTNTSQCLLTSLEQSNNALGAYETLDRSTLG